MNRDALRGFLQLGFFVGGCGALTSLLVPRESGEFVVSVCSAAMGLAVVALALVVARWMGNPPDIDV